MKYKINTNELMKDTGKIDEIEAIKRLYDAVRAILYLLEVREFAISEELYLKLSDDGKKFFIGI